jgi:hypothetical protein
LARVSMEPPIDNNRREVMFNEQNSSEPAVYQSFVPVPTRKARFSASATVKTPWNNLLISLT